MKILFAGSPNSSAQILRCLISGSLEVVGVISQPNKRSKRKKGIEPCEVSAAAIDLALPLYRPICLDDGFKEIISRLEFDFLVVCAYGKILPEWLLALPKKAAINIHFSLLPKYRGASPIQAAILNGDSVTGISIMQMTKGLDEGPVYFMHEVSIEASDNKQLLENKLTSKASNILVSDLNKIIDEELTPTKQDDAGVVLCSKITKISGKIDFINEETQVIMRRFNAFHEWPGLFFERAGVVIKIHGLGLIQNSTIEKNSGNFQFILPGILAKTKDGAIVITHLQFPGKRIITANDAVNSYADFFLK